jgi:peptide/nickel transport system ATP-binding protein
MEALLEVRKLCIGIQQETTLLSSVEDVSFDIYPGEIVGLAGESGSGKSLTALSVAGLLGENKKVTKGSILYKKDADTGALNLLNISEKEFAGIRGKEISMIFQEPFSSLNPLVKVGAQIAETLELHGEKDKALNKGRVRELMEKLGLPETEKLESAYPHRLSGGMCQRIMIALAIICRPRLLIADEPVTALDFNTQIQILGLMKEINRDLGASILFISHDLGLIKNFCDRVLVMYSGRILEEGKTNEVFTNPAHEYTRGLLGSIPEKRGKDLAAIPGRVPSLEEGRPKGCPFHPRCAKAMQACMEDFPEARSAGADHTSRCVLEKGQRPAKNLKRYIPSSLCETCPTPTFPDPGAYSEKRK